MVEHQNIVRKDKDIVRKDKQKNENYKSLVHSV
jgi:hypothetical protein